MSLGRVRIPTSRKFKNNKQRNSKKSVVYSMGNPEQSRQKIPDSMHLLAATDKNSILDVLY